MTRDFIAPPLTKNGNPLSAYGVNQIIDSVNTLRSNYFDFNVLKQRNINFNNIAAWTTRYALVHTFDYLYVNIAVNSAGPIKVYAKAGQNGTSTLIHTFSSYSAPTTLTQTISLTSLGYAYGDVYLISFSNPSTYNGAFTVQYLYEYTGSSLTAPTIPTLTSSTVVDDTYLNNIIDAIRNIPSYANVNVPFNGVGAPGDYNASAYMRWLGRRRSRYLSYGFRLIDQDVTAEFYIDSQLIHTQDSGNATGISTYNLSYDFQTNPAGITVPAIGADYTFSVEYDHNNATSAAAACYIDYAWEADYL